MIRRLRNLLPSETRGHMGLARKEALLALRSLIEASLVRVDRSLERTEEQLEMRQKVLRIEVE
ncbi:MAG: hypothetical protein M1358_20785 [Chloroflexi bacterium]|nr:hypothetical protein [Chloroflexota bacterium]